VSDDRSAKGVEETVVRLALDDIQGDITPGFRTDCQDLVFLYFDEEKLAAAKEWLGWLTHQLSSARQVISYNRIRRLQSQGKVTPPDYGQADPPDNGTAGIDNPCVNIAFTYQGLQRLQVNDLSGFPTEFVANAQARASRVGDDAQRYKDWEVGGLDSEPDALLVLGADTPAQMEKLNALHAERWMKCVDRCVVEHGETLGSGKEHFGFRDGISQPDPVEPSDDGWTASPDGQLAAPGEFILGQPNALGSTHVTGPSWAHNGSYVVFRKLEQRVYRFRQQTRALGEKYSREAGAQAGNPEWFAEKLIGRRRDGVAFDALGEGCPLFAHIQKAHPRTHTELEPNRHRIIRRGIPYGKPIDPGDNREVAAQDDTGRGLLFLAYQASIRDQYEHIVSQWMNDSMFPPARPASGFRNDGTPTQAEHPGWDPLIGTTGTSKFHTVFFRSGAADTFEPIELDEFVAPLGGAYLFSPSISAVRGIATSLL
jgi:Dyp-type peroxidase family